MNFSPNHVLHDPLISLFLGLMNLISPGSRVKAAHNTTTAALRVVEGDEKGTGWLKV
jgi:hypothetical protein